MANRTFMIVLDASDPRVDPAAVTEFIKGSDAFAGWWHHLPYAFMVTSGRDAEAISEMLKPITKTARFFVVEVNLSESEGLLHRQSWDWIKRRVVAVPAFNPADAMPAGADSNQA